LSKNDFLELLNEPLLSWVTFEQGQNLVTTSQAIWLDVRLPPEHQSDAIKGDEHIPLIFLRMKIGGLDQNKSYIVYCDTGRRSSAASYLLNERGITSYVLKDGLGSVPAEFRTAKS
jgi:rhodanese-related sulfurtransferase